MSPTGDGTHRQDDAPSGVLGTSLARLNKNSQARVSGSRPRDPPVKTCKMQDVVLLPFPLTDLWGNSQPVYDEDAADEPTPHTYKGNSDQIPKEISDLCERIKGFKTNTAGLPCVPNSETVCGITLVHDMVSLGRSRHCSSTSETRDCSVRRNGHI